MTTLAELLTDGREIWGDEYLPLGRIATCLGVTAGDLHRLQRDVDEGQPLDLEQVAKECGNVVLSMVRWIDDLGLPIEGCLDLARVAQRNYVAKRGKP